MPRQLSPFPVLFRSVAQGTNEVTIFSEGTASTQNPGYKVQDKTRDIMAAMDICAVAHVGDVTLRGTENAPSFLTENIFIAVAQKEGTQATPTDTIQPLFSVTTMHCVRHRAKSLDRLSRLRSIGDYFCDRTARLARV